MSTNIRNTERIAQVFGSLAGERAASRGLDGPPVRFVQCEPEEAVARADDAVDQLVQVWEPRQLALLTTRTRHPVQQEVVEGHGWQESWDEFFAGKDVFYGHVMGFKGLERQAVVLAVNGFKQPERAREMPYVGLSRARTQLVVCSDLAQITAVGGEGVKRRLLAAEQRQPCRRACRHAVPCSDQVVAGLGPAAGAGCGADRQRRVVAPGSVVIPVEEPKDPAIARGRISRCHGRGGDAQPATARAQELRSAVDYSTPGP